MITIICAENEYVSNHTCQACPTGTYNATGDPASGPDTVCDSILCNNNYYVSDHKCIVCAPGKYNDGGDDASGPDTVCDIIECAENEYVSNYACQACPSGTYNAAGDLANGSDTVCDASFVTITTVYQTMSVYNAPLVHTIQAGMTRVDLILYAILYNALKMNMFPIILVKHVPQALTI